MNDRYRNFRPKPIPKPKLFRFGFGSVILTETETAFFPHFLLTDHKNSSVNSNYATKIATNDTKTQYYIIMFISWCPSAGRGGILCCSSNIDNTYLLYSFGIEFRFRFGFGSVKSPCFGFGSVSVKFCFGRSLFL